MSQTGPDYAVRTLYVCTGRESISAECQVVQHRLLRKFGTVKSPPAAVVDRTFTKFLCSMSFFALKEWAAANVEYNVDIPPYWHAKAVPDAFTALSGILWSASYILMTMKAFKDKSYAMPIHCLCLNITWEAVFGFVYGPGLINQIVFAQWVIVDIFLFYAIVKSGKHQWRHSPLVQQNLTWIILGGCALCLWLHLSVAATFVPHIGRRVVFFTAWPMQLVINIGSIAQILSRGHTAGHSWSIW